MARRLTQRSVEAARPRAGGERYRLSDGNGLLLEVRPGGSKGWLCRITVAGRGRRDMGLDDWPGVSLAEARRLALEAKREARAGLDPIEERAQRARAREAARAAEREAAGRTFAAVAEAFIAGQAPGWRHRRTAGMWRASLAQHAFPVLGALPVAEVDRAAVQRAIAAVWASRPATARKVLWRIGAVLRHAAVLGWRTNDDVADPRLLRLAGLPALPAGRSRPSLPWQRLPAFLKALDALPGLAPLALRFAILTAARTGEARGARWSELSFGGGGVATWTVPAERMKGSHARERAEPHRVPLSAAALATLARAAYGAATGTAAAPALAPTPAELPELAARMGRALIFPTAPRRRRRREVPVSNMALWRCVQALNEAARAGPAAPPQAAGEPVPWRDAEGRAVTPHGFRATFRTWIDDTCPAEAEAAERALAHVEMNRVRAAYRRSDLFDRRVPLMAAWGRWCEGEAAGAPRRRRRASPRRRADGVAEPTRPVTPRAAGSGSA